MTTQNFDVLIVGDSRFGGGSTGALAADVNALSQLGLSIGLLFVRSAYLDDSRDPPNPKALALLDLPGVTALTDGATASAPIAFLHHPLVFYRGIEETATLTADRTYLITHHAPFRADGSVEYDPMQTIRRAKAALGLTAVFAPISGVVRGQLASFAPLIALSAEDWPNIFDPADWPATRPIFQSDVLTIGRHGRADGLKWPGTGAEITASLPADAQTRVRALGCPVDALTAKGVDVSAWDVLAFGSESVPDFLNSLDVFVYHYSPLWIEAFGRTIAEALLTGRLCLLDPRLKPAFGDMAHYCGPGDVAAMLAQFRADPDAARAFAAQGQQKAIAAFGQASVAARLDRLRGAHPTRSRDGSAMPPINVFRKLIGHHRRRARGATG